MNFASSPFDAMHMNASIEAFRFHPDRESTPQQFNAKVAKSPHLGCWVGGVVDRVGGLTHSPDATKDPFGYASGEADHGFPGSGLDFESE